MGSFGERMQREREMRGITLEEIAESTKIGTRSLRALEGEDFDKLPGGIFNKGFVRAYARYLGIDEEQAVTDFMAAYGDHQQQLPQAPEGEVKQQDEQERSLNLLAIGGAVLLLIGFFVIWGFHDRIAGAAGQIAHRLRHVRSVEALPPAAAAPMPAPTAPSPVNPASTSAPTTALAATPAPSSSAIEATKVPPAKPSEAAVATKNPSESKPSATAAVPSAKPALELAAGGREREFVVVVRARQDAWVKIKADDELLMEGTLKGEGEKTVHAKQKVVLTTGNAGAIELSFNGQPQPTLGDDNQVKTVVFTPDGRLR